MRSIFWKFFFAFWLLIALIIGLSLTLGRWISEDKWLFERYPGFQHYAQEWTKLYQEQGLTEARKFSEERLQKYAVMVSVWTADEQLLLTLPAHRNRRFMRGMGMMNQIPPGVQMVPHHMQSASPGQMRRSSPRFQQFAEEYRAPNGLTLYFRYAVPMDTFSLWQKRTLFWPMITIVLLGSITLLSWALSAYIVRPVNQLREAVGELEEGRYDSELLKHISSRSDELGLLAKEFNQMGQRLQSLLDSQRHLLRAVSHELRSPLARLRIALAMAERDAEQGNLTNSNWAKMEKECSRLDSLIGEILSLARLDSNTEKPADIPLAPLLKQVIAEFPEQSITLSGDQTLEVTGWKNWLAMAFSNILRNAIRFNPPEKAIDVTLTAHNDQAQIRIKDDGPGCSAEILSLLGKPFYRAPGQTTEGHGLGLAIVRRIIDEHKGIIRFESQPGSGLTVLIDLPCKKHEHKTETTDH